MTAELCENTAFRSASRRARFHRFFRQQRSPPMKEFSQSVWNAAVEEDWNGLLELSLLEDLGDLGDLTTLALVPADARGSAAVVARQVGIVAGIPGVQAALDAVETSLQWSPDKKDGDPIAPGERLGVISGSVQGMLAAERLVLNLLGRLSGVATLTSRYVEAIRGTKANIYDTRKTTPGWRRLEKYAVRCGGGRNHRLGLCSAVLIKDNHLAWGASGNSPSSHYTPAEAVLRARDYLNSECLHIPENERIVELEVDTLEQLKQALPSSPDIVLLDNMPPDVLLQAVAVRNEMNPGVQLEASGGVNLNTVRAIAESGVERISVGALTHSAVVLDFGLDWLDG